MLIHRHPHPHPTTPTTSSDNQQLLTSSVDLFICGKRVLKKLYLLIHIDKIKSNIAIDMGQT